MSTEQEDRATMMQVLSPAGVEDRQVGRQFAGLILHERQAKAIADALIAAGFSRHPVPEREWEYCRAVSGYPSPCRRDESPTHRRVKQGPWLPVVPWEEKD